MDRPMKIDLLAPASFAAGQPIGNASARG